MCNSLCYSCGNACEMCVFPESLRHGGAFSQCAKSYWLNIECRIKGSNTHYCLPFQKHTQAQAHTYICIYTHLSHQLPSSRKMKEEKKLLRKNTCLCATIHEDFFIFFFSLFSFSCCFSDSHTVSEHIFFSSFFPSRFFLLLICC